MSMLGDQGRDLPIAVITGVGFRTLEQDSILVRRVLHPRGLGDC